MISNEIREKLHDIVRGACLQGATDHCSTVRNLLIEGFEADPTVKSQFESRAVVKEKQNSFLKSHATNHAFDFLASKSKHFRRTLRTPPNGKNPLHFRRVGTVMVQIIDTVSVFASFIVTTLCSHQVRRKSHLGSV
jgi:hypothetical protein